MIYDLRKELQPGDVVITKKGFEFEVTECGYLDKTTNLEWEIEFGVGMNLFQALEWAKEKNKRIPTTEDFELAEKHGIRELPEMQWRNYAFWIFEGYSNEPNGALSFFGNIGKVYEVLNCRISAVRLVNGKI